MFGDQGVLIHLPQGVSTASARDATFDSEGRLVVAGQAHVDGQDAMIACRFGSDGALDSAFGRPSTPGCYSLSADGGIAHAVVVQNGTGRVIVAGSVTSGGQRLGLILGLVPNGSGPDQEFGAGFGLQFIPSNYVDESPTEFFHIAQNAQGELAAAGYAAFQQNKRYMPLYRLTPDGQPDSDFPNQGTLIVGGNAVFDGAYFAEAASVVLLDNGSVLVAGHVQTSEISFRPTVARLQANGVPDQEFAYDSAWMSSYTVIYDLCTDPCDMRVHDSCMLSNGKIVMSGTIRQGAQGDDAEVLAGRGDFFVMRLLSNGQPDPTFRSADSNHDGLSIIPFDAYSEPPEDVAYSLAIQSDRVLVAGLARTDSDPDNEMSEFNAAIARIGNGEPVFADGFE